jgi:hypothetical protein
LNFLVEDLGDFNVAQGAAVTDFTDLSVLDDLSELGSAGVFELGGGDIGLLVEERHDLVVVGDGTGSQVTDQTLVALSGFGIVQGDEGIVVLSRPLSTTAQESGSQNETLEEDNTSQEAEGSSRGRGDGGGGTSSGSSFDDEGGGGHVGDGSKGHRAEDETVHAKN